MTDLEAIRLRHSRRSFAGPLPQEAADTLTRLASALARSHGITIQYEADNPELFGGFMKSYGMFSGVRSFFILSGSAENEFRDEMAGRCGERLVLELTKMGLGSCWVAGSFNRQGIARTLGTKRSLSAVIAAGPPPPRQDLRERLAYRMNHRTPKSPQEMVVTDEAPPAWFLEGADAVARAPSALSRQPVLLHWKKGEACISVPQMGLFEALDLGIAKLHFEIAVPGGFTPGNYGVFTPSAQGREQGL